jgi:predicted nucleic acid-binding Zn ribbon protein
MSHYCQSCQRVLYNRRLTHCGFCGAPIPENLRFTPEEIAALDRNMAEMEEQRKQRERAAAEAEEEARRRDAGAAGASSAALM